MLSLRPRTFGKGGVHPQPHKELTAERPIELLPMPPEVWLPLQQHIGEPAIPLVTKGDRVVRGQKIAEGGQTGVPIHATITGKVKPIDKRPHPTLVSAESIAISRAEGAEEMEFPEDPDWRRCSREEALARIREAGIVGLGGAAFPTFRKLTLPAGVTVDTLVVNGAECEPYLTSDYRIMLSQPLEVIEGEFTGLPLPARAEIVVEGEVVPGEWVDEGPFGEWHGYYANRGLLSVPEPVIQVKAIYHRNNPIFTCSMPAVPPHTFSLFLSVADSVGIRRRLEAFGIPGIKSVWSHYTGAGGLFNVISIEQMYSGHATKAGVIASQYPAGMGAYTVVKASMFNGINLPSVYSVDQNGDLKLRQQFGFEDYLRKCGGRNYVSI